MSHLRLILIVFAFVLMALEAFKVGHPRVSLGWLGLSLWCLTTLLLPAVS